MIVKMLKKGCTKCGGDLYLEQDEDGYALKCLQCASVDVAKTRLLYARLHAQQAKRPALVGAYTEERLPVVSR